MKVLVFTDYFPPHVGGGVEKAAYEISKMLVESDTEISVLTLNSRNAERFESMNGISVYRAAASDTSGYLRLQSRLSLEAPRLAVKICREFDPDVLHAHNIFFFTSLVAAGAKRLVRKPLVVTMHLGPVNMLDGLVGRVTRAYERTIGRWILRSGNQVIAVSKAVKNHAINLGVPEGKVTVIPNGVDLREFSPRANRSERKVKKIAFVGRLFPNKGVCYLVKAAPAILSKYPVEFVIVGDGPLRREIEKMTDRLGIGKAFRFIRWTPYITDVLSDCDIFVRPSLTEGMPLTILEAMACSLPVVATSVSGTPELIIDGVTGLLCPPKAPAGLSDAILALIGNPDEAARLGNNARKFVERYHSWREISDNTRRVYDLVRHRPCT